MRFTDLLDKPFYILIGGFVCVAFSLLLWGLVDEVTTERDYILDNVGHRWEVRHIGGNEYLYSRGRLVMLRRCECGGVKRDSL